MCPYILMNITELQIHMCPTEHNMSSEVQTSTMSRRHTRISLESFVRHFIILLGVPIDMEYNNTKRERERKRDREE